MSILDWRRISMSSNGSSSWNLVDGFRPINPALPGGTVLFYLYNWTWSKTNLYRYHTSFNCSNTRKATVLQTICPYLWWGNIQLQLKGLVWTYWDRTTACQSIWSNNDIIVCWKEHYVTCDSAYGGWYYGYDCNTRYETFKLHMPQAA